MTQTFPDYLRLHTGDVSLEAVVPSPAVPGLLRSDDPPDQLKLAAGETLAPVTEPLGSRDRPLVDRLSRLLTGGLHSLHCQAAAIYTLDDRTTQLELAVQLGLSPEQTLAAVRPLAGAMADLEALTGHAVVLESPALFAYWQAPLQGMGAALCVPIVSPALPLGTLWLFDGEARNFRDEEIRLAELVAERIASELEMSARRLRNQRTAAAYPIEKSTPATSTKRKPAKNSAGTELATATRNCLTATTLPELEAYTAAGGIASRTKLGGGFRDWFVTPEGDLNLLVGCLPGDDVSAAILSAGLHAVLQGFGQQYDPELTLRKGEAYLQRSTAGHLTASACLLQLEQEQGHLRWSTAGKCQVLRVRGARIEVLSGPTPALGTAGGAELSLEEALLDENDWLVMLAGQLPQTEGLTRCLARLGQEGVHTPQAWVDRLIALPPASQRSLSAAAEWSHLADRAVIVLRRRSGS